VIDDGPLLIADYGSSQGRNSMPPMTIAIAELRARAGAERPIQVVHTDLPSNDFAALFAALEADPASYMKSHANVYASAIGRSYFEQLLPTASVTLGWNSWTVHWMSDDNMVVPDHVFPGMSKHQSIIDEVARRQAEDWRKFLSCRAKELKRGARMLTAFVGRDQGTTGWNWLGDNFWGAIEDLGRDGLLSTDEQQRMSVPANGRSLEQIRAPFDGHGEYAGLRLVKAEVLTVPDGNWTAYQKSGDAKTLGTAHANMLRAVFSPTLANALGARPDTADLLDKLFTRLATRLAVAPQIHEGRLASVVLERV
jgi:SAM dependent carboxyl methyltransferase